MVFRARRSRPSSSEAASVSDFPEVSAGEEDRVFDNERGGTNDPAGVAAEGRVAFALGIGSPMRETLSLNRTQMNDRADCLLVLPCVSRSSAKLGVAGGGFFVRRSYTTVGGMPTLSGSAASITVSFVEDFRAAGEALVTSFKPESG